MPFGSLYFQGFQTAGLGNSATLDSGLRLSFFRFRRNRVSVPRKQCHVRQWIKTPRFSRLRKRLPPRKQCHVRQWIKTVVSARFQYPPPSRKQCHVRQWIKTRNFSRKVVFTPLGNSATLDSGLYPFVNTNKKEGFMHLYITEQGTRLSKKGEHLIISKDGIVKEELLLNHIDSLNLFGAIHPTTDAMLSLLEAGTDISFLSRGGRFKGRLVSGVGKNVMLRLKQYEAFHDSVRAFEIAKSYVLQKLQNGLRVLDAYHNNPHNRFRFEERGEYIKNIRAVEKFLEPEREILRGYEGFGAKIYFQCFARCLVDDFGFHGREFYPSRDPVNSLLSLGYTFVSRNIESLLESYGLDPMIGFLHEPCYGRPSLACDLLEEFRHPFVDRLVLKLFNRKIISAEDFEFRNEDGGAGQLYLKQESMKVFIRCYEEFCDASNRVYKDDGEISWRKVLRMRVEMLRKSLLENVEIVPFEWNASLPEVA